MVTLSESDTFRFAVDRVTSDGRLTVCQQIHIGGIMKVCTVLFMFVIAIGLGCGSDGNGTDEGGLTDVGGQDVSAPDTNTSDVETDLGQQEDANTGDTGGGIDTNTTPDQGLNTDLNVNQDQGGTDTTQACPTGVPTGPSCLEVAACAVLCDDAAFETTCLAQAETAAADAWAALKACAATNECVAIFQAEQVSDCLISSCGTEAGACVVGESTCRDIWTCRKDCPAEDPTCAMKCIASGTTEAQEQWIEYKNCILDIDCSSEDVMENGWPTFSCEQYARGFCSLPYQACFPPT